MLVDSVCVVGTAPLALVAMAAEGATGTGVALLLADFLATGIPDAVGVLVTSGGGVEGFWVGAVGAGVGAPGAGWGAASGAGGGATGAGGGLSGYAGAATGAGAGVGVGSCIGTQPAGRPNPSL